MRRVSLMLAACALAGLSLDAQIGKKVFISVDMEGISGISGADQLSADGAEYSRSRKLMADDVNAAIRGARAGGASEIVVNDSHGSMRNLRLEDLDPGVRLISHSFKSSGMMEGLDESFDGVIFIGYHAQAGSPVGLFAHTGSGIVADVRVNGRSLGEGGLNTLVAGWYGVPVVLVTGDNVALNRCARSRRGSRCSGEARDQLSGRLSCSAGRGASRHRDRGAGAVAGAGRSRRRGSPLTKSKCASAIRSFQKSPRSCPAWTARRPTRSPSPPIPWPAPIRSSAFSTATSTPTKSHGRSVRLQPDSCRSACPPPPRLRRVRRSASREGGKADTTSS